MIEGLPPSQQALYGTLFTWFVTALGSGVVFLEPLLPGSPAAHQLFLDTMLGFAGGVMIAASYWSLLAPGASLARRCARAARSLQGAERCSVWMCQRSRWQNRTGTERRSSHRSICRTESAKKSPTHGSQLRSDLLRGGYSLSLGTTYVDHPPSLSTAVWDPSDTILSVTDDRSLVGFHKRG